MRPRPRLSALVSACRRLNAVGKAQQAHRARKEEEDAGADRDDAEEVDGDAHSGSSRFRRRGAVDEGDGGEGGEQRQAQGDILDPAHAGRRGDQQERGDAAGADELRRHHAIDVARPAQDAHEPDRHGEQDDARGREQELSHRRSPG